MAGTSGCIKLDTIVLATASGSAGRPIAVADLGFPVGGGA